MCGAAIARHGDIVQPIRHLRNRRTGFSCATHVENLKYHAHGHDLIDRYTPPHHHQQHRETERQFDKHTAFYGIELRLLVICPNALSKAFRNASTGAIIASRTVIVSYAFKRWPAT